MSRRSTVVRKQRFGSRFASIDIVNSDGCRSKNLPTSTMLHARTDGRTHSHTHARTHSLIHALTHSRTHEHGHECAYGARGNHQSTQTGRRVNMRCCVLQGIEALALHGAMGARVRSYRGKGKEL